MFAAWKTMRQITKNILIFGEGFSIITLDF